MARLPMLYRFTWRMRWLGYQLLGPAQLDEERDPVERLIRERRAREQSLEG